jgi:general secretion pathway protein F
MPLFRYTAIDMAGKRLSGTMEAASVPAVADHLHGRHHLLLRADEVGKGGRIAELLHMDLRFSRGLPKAAIAQFTRELAVMLEAGQDIDRALRFLAETSGSNTEQKIFESLRDQVRGGKSFAASLAEHPSVFSRLYVSLVRAGEAGGQLAPGLSHLATLLERESKLNASIQSALIYPALLVVAAVGTIGLLLTYVLPQFTPIFAQAGAKLPVQTRFLIATGDLVRNDGLWILLGLLIFGLGAYRSLQTSQVRLAVERMTLRLPIIGLLVRRIQAARLTRTLGTLLCNGVNLVTALGIGHDVLGNLTAAAIVDRAASKVRAGGRLAPALAEGQFFPVQTVQLLQLGEETGRLGEMALRVADIHDEQVFQMVQRLVALLVPVITIIMGIIVAGIVGSLLVAMLSLNDLAA